MTPSHDTRKLNSRAFVALMMGLSGLGLPVTGIVNHAYGFSPPSSARHAWMSAHNALGVLFVAFSIWHIVLNRRALLNHVRSAASQIPAIRRELLVAAAVVTVTLLLSVGHALHAGSGLLR